MGYVSCWVVKHYSTSEAILGKQVYIDRGGVVILLEFLIYLDQ